MGLTCPAQSDVAEELKTLLGVRCLEDDLDSIKPCQILPLDECFGGQNCPISIMIMTCLVKGILRVRFSFAGAFKLRWVWDR